MAFKIEKFYGSPLHQEKESSYQPVKDREDKKVKGYPLTSEQAKVVDEDHHEFDHKPAESDVKKAAFINAKMKKMKKKSQGRKAVKDLNKAVNNIKTNN